MSVFLRDFKLTFSLHRRNIHTVSYFTHHLTPFSHYYRRNNAFGCHPELDDSQRDDARWPEGNGNGDPGASLCSPNDS